MWPVECRLFLCSTVTGRTQVRELRSRPSAESLASGNPWDQAVDLDTSLRPVQRKVSVPKEASKFCF